ncbi:MAG: helix-turn-helix domain-containing protein [Microbacterium sp.]
MPIQITETEELRARREKAQEAIRRYDVVDVNIVCDALRQSPRVVRAAIESGDLKAIRLGRSVRIPTAQLRDLLGID